MITNLITTNMANPFFSGRIPTALSDEIEDSLSITGETKSEFLIRALRYTLDNQSSYIASHEFEIDIRKQIAEILIRLERVESLSTRSLSTPTENSSSLSRETSEPDDSTDYFDPAVNWMDINSFLEKYKLFDKSTLASDVTKARRLAKQCGEDIDRVSFSGSLLSDRVKIESDYFRGR